MKRKYSADHTNEEHKEVKIPRQYEDRSPHQIDNTVNSVQRINDQEVGNTNVDPSDHSSLKKSKVSKQKGTSYPCDLCDYVATKLWDLKKHKESKHEGIRYLCDKCDYLGTSSSALKKHMEMMHE